MRILSLIGLISTLAASIDAAIPPFFKLCNRDDPKLNKCLKSSIQFALRNMGNGYDDGELRIPQLEPYVEKEFTLDYMQNQISAKAYLKDVKSYGNTGGVVHAVRANLQDDSFDIEVDMTNKRFFVEGFFRVEGRLNAIVVSSKGHYNNTMHDLKWTWKISGAAEKRDGKTYMRIKRFVMRPEVGEMEINLPSIFPNNPQLDRIALNFAQNYWRLIYQELLPVVENVWSKIGIKFLNKIFLKIPYDDLFPVSF